MQTRYSDTAYVFRDSGVYSMIDVLDYTGFELRIGVTIGDAISLVKKWESGEENPYLTAFGLDTKV